MQSFAREHSRWYRPLSRRPTLELVHRMSPANSPPGRTVHVVALALTRPHPELGRQLFVARRSKGRRHGGLWELPGGQVEPGETEPHALVREIREELHIHVTLGRRLGAATVQTEAIAVHMVVYSADQFTGSIQLVDHDDARWTTADALDDFDWAPADVPHLPALRTLLTGTQ